MNNRGDQESHETWPLGRRGVCGVVERERIVRERGGARERSLAPLRPDPFGDSMVLLLHAAF